jgi:hypothetical protein
MNLQRFAPALVVLIVAAIAVFGTLQSGCSDDCTNSRGGCKAEPED